MKTLKKVWVIIFLFLFYVVFLDKEVVLESHSPYTDRHIQVIQYGTGIFGWKTVRVVYLDRNEVIAKKPFALLRQVGSFNDRYVSWIELERSLSESVSIETVYSTNFFGDAESRRMEFTYASLETETRTSPYYP
ncbi:hypothetical protein [Domibacillus iocasae]|uniref:hypothetical protein n=1 Tax=Domibacillus iocasae TaxID=1714016 RepID=UPI00114CE74D|nr:hypothetical protein [Domibacillus iocasae]